MNAVFSKYFQQLKKVFEILKYKILNGEYLKHQIILKVFKIRISNTSISDTAQLWCGERYAALIGYARILAHSWTTNGCSYGQQRTCLCAQIELGSIFKCVVLIDFCCSIMRTTKTAKIF